VYSVESHPTFRRAMLLPSSGSEYKTRRHVPPKRRLTFNGLHGVISQKTELFITTAVRTSNPTQSLFILRIIGNALTPGRFKIKEGGAYSNYCALKGFYHMPYLQRANRTIYTCTVGRQYNTSFDWRYVFPFCSHDPVFPFHMKLHISIPDATMSRNDVDF
jgi:hypothetical protein